jgi:predicted MFS family arabinose efflux permease
MKQVAHNDNTKNSSREPLLWLLSAATFIIFFQAYMVAPLIPKLASLFGVPEQAVGLMVPAYLVPYAIATLFYGLLADRIGPKLIILSSLLAFVILTGLSATATSARDLIIWRLLTGIGASGVIPISLALIVQLYSYEERGRPLGWLFGAMAGGSAFGSTIGVVVEPFIGWQLLFIGVAISGLIVLGILWVLFKKISRSRAASGRLSFQKVLEGYKQLLSNVRGARTYVYVFLNGVFHSGVFT